MVQTKEALRVAKLHRRRRVVAQTRQAKGTQNPLMNEMALQVVQVAAERLPLRLRRELAERLLASVAPEQKTVTVRLRRLPHSKQSRLAKLLDKNTDGKLTKAEQAELQKLGKEVDETMLSNSMALARAARPELFDLRGRLIKSRFRQTYGSGSTRAKGSRRENTHR